MTQTRLHIPEMDCPSEGTPIEAALRAKAGVSEVRIDYERRTVTVTHDALLTDSHAIKRAVEALAFAASLLPALDAKGPWRFFVEELSSESDGAAIAQHLEALHPKHLAVDPITRTVTIEAANEESTPLTVLTRLQTAGYRAHYLEPSEAAEASEHDEPLPWRRLFLALAFALGAEALDVALEYQALSLPFSEGVGHAASLSLALIAIGLSGLDTVKRGLKALFARHLNMNALMAVAVIGGVLIGAYPEAAMVMVLFEISEVIEALSMARARRSIRELMSVTPETAQIVSGEDSPQTSALSVADVMPGMRVRIAPGDRVPLDGTILVGETSLDESMVTGEGLPTEKGPGATVWAGTVNLSSTIDVTVTAKSSESLSARIIEAVERAQGAKSPVQRFVDRFALVYTPSVFALALLVALVPPLFLGDPLEWIYKALVILVIACPCALVISTPVTIVSALATATRCGLLIKGGLYLEEARHLKNVALDKTGTLTLGEPDVMAAFTPEGKPLSDPETERLAASLANANRHPLSKAITKRAKTMSITPSPVIGFKAIPGFGVEGRVEGVLLRLVNRRYLEEAGLMTPALIATFNELAEMGASSVALMDLFGVRAVYGFTDPMKSGTYLGLRELESVGLTPWLLTGDNRAAAQKLAKEAHITHVRAELLPDDKLRAITELQKTGLTAMVGDGINDAPALAQADIGVAMGIKGTDSAIEAAPVVVMDDNIASLATLVRLSRLTHTVLIQNIVFALSLKALFALLAFGGLATMWMAVFADTGTCLIVVANGLRLLKVKPRLERESEAVKQSLERGETR